MEAIIFKGLAILMTVVVTALVTHFIATKNMESIMDKVAEKAITNHNNIKHQDSPWDIAEKIVGDHKKTCGDEIKCNLRDVIVEVKNTREMQIEVASDVKNISSLVNLISKKLNIS